MPLVEPRQVLFLHVLHLGCDRMQACPLDLSRQGLTLVHLRGKNGVVKSATWLITGLLVVRLLIAQLLDQILTVFEVIFSLGASLIVSVSHLRALDVSAGSLPGLSYVIGLGLNHGSLLVSLAHLSVV